MPCLFLEYPKCSTCQKARRWLDEQQISYTARHIVEQRPNEQELSEWIRLSNMPIKSFFNTSGLAYKALGLKDKLPAMSETEQIRLLATNGMLVKRPLLVGKDFAIPGFKPELWLTKLRG